MTPITEQSISNHPLFENVTRTVCVDSFQVISSRQQFNMCFSVRYEKDVDGAKIDITSTLSQPASTSIVATNGTEVLVRDELFQPVLNPAWDGQDEGTKYLTMRAYDYLLLMLDKQVTIKDVLNAYILVNDADGFFNK